MTTCTFVTLPAYWRVRQRARLATSTSRQRTFGGPAHPVEDVRVGRRMTTRPTSDDDSTDPVDPMAPGRSLKDDSDDDVEPNEPA
jgi:hypothetical protein